MSTDVDTTPPAGWPEEIDDHFRAASGPGRGRGRGLRGRPSLGTAWARLLFGVVAVVAALTGRVLHVTGTDLAFYRGAFGGHDTRLTQGGDELDVLRRLWRLGSVLFVRSNPTYTSARRLQRGLLHSLVVSRS